MRSRKSPLMMGFGRRPQHEQTVQRRGRRSKASQGGNRGQERLRLQRGIRYGNLKAAVRSGRSIYRAPAPASDDLWCDEEASRRSHTLVLTCFGLLKRVRERVAAVSGAAR
jgi:hypothetical protein